MTNAYDSSQLKLQAADRLMSDTVIKNQHEIHD